jgi:hypothetical protein
MTNAQTKFLENAPFLAALTSAIAGRETSKDRLSAKDELPVLVHTIQIEGQPVKVRIATDTRCSAINEFLQKYSDEALQLSQTTSTRKVQLKDIKIPSLFIYEAAKPKLVPKQEANAVEAAPVDPSYAPIPEFNEAETKPKTKILKRK